MVTSALQGVLYMMALYAAITKMDSFDPDRDFTSLEGVYNMFRNPTAVFAGWVHYCSFDMLVGLGISQDSLKRGVSNVFYYMVVVPCLFLCCMFGPTGLVTYLVIRFFALPDQEKKRKTA